jgi:5-methylcytosine-specific restriction protein A
MPGWTGSDRHDRLPPDWARRRARVLARDGRQCTHTRADTGLRCSAIATDVDHVEPGDDHSDSNLTSLCHHHHLRKSGAEGGRASRQPTTKRRTHPGILP